MNIIESIGSWGVKTTSERLMHMRMQRPKSGDIIEFTDTEYPHIHGKYGRIEYYDKSTDEFHICDELGSAFLNENGSVSISGGPFEHVKADRLTPKMELHLATYWNFGNNGAGGGNGVHYYFERPVFILDYKEGPEKRRTK